MESGKDIETRLKRFAESLKSDTPISRQYNYRTVRLDLVPTEYSPAMVKNTRKLLGASQSVFASFLGVSVSLVQDWEQGRRKPQQMACRFMDEIQVNPKYWQDRMLKLVEDVKC